MAWTACSGSADRSMILEAASENLLSQIRSKYSDCERRLDQCQGQQICNIPVSRPLLCGLEMFGFHT